MIHPLATTLLALAPQTSEPGPGISRALATARRAAIGEVAYDLRFVLGDDAELVRGSVFLKFELRDEPGGPLVLDFAGEDLTEVNVNGRDAELARAHDHVLLPAALLVRGVNGMRATFRSRIAATGTPLTVYRDPADGRRYLYTLLVPADAHGLFPCFDQPDLRARFRLELDLPWEWTAIGNAAPLPEQPEPRNAIERTSLLPVEQRLWRFAATAPLPTYLFAFACGPFAVVEAPPPRAPGVGSTAPMRFLVRPSRLADLDREALVRLHHDGLGWLAAEYGVPYPFDKLDVALLPGFPYGGMEHAGAIFYRESALVFDHEPTPAELVRRSALVYHELAHQWFGNLVTMRWFDDLWLKEGFATFYAYRALEALEPERRAWLRFLQRVKPRAYEVDGTPGTTPIYQELENLADAKSAYGAIVYNKAPAVLRALFERLGPDVFRAGTRGFLEQHAFGAADWRDLAAALAGAARQDLGRWSERWLLAASMPQVRVEWQLDGDGNVAGAVVTQRAIGGDGSWPLDLELLVIEASGERTLLAVASDAASTPVPGLEGKPAPHCVLANPRDAAYGQFVPDPVSRAWLLAHLSAEADPLVRAAGVLALFEATREAELDPAAMAGLLLELLAGEADADTHNWLCDLLRPCLHRWLPNERAALLRARATALLLDQLAAPEPTGRELSIFRHVARASAEPAVLRLCQQVVDGEQLPAGLAPGREDAFLAAGALVAAGAGEAVIAKVARRFAGQDVGRESFLAAAATPTAAAKQRMFARYLQRDDPPEQWTIDSLPWFHWPGQEELTLPFLRRALDQVDELKRHRRIFFLPAWLDGFVNAHSTPAALAIVDQFLATRRLDPDVRKKLQQARDGLWRAVRIRAAFAGEER